MAGGAGADASPASKDDPATDTSGSMTPSEGSVSAPGSAGAMSGSTGSTGTTDPSTPSADTGASGTATSSGGVDEDAMKAHSDDQVVAGKIAKVSPRSLVIRTDTGEETTLQLVPQTGITVDGRDGRRTQLEEGQEVRASFNEVNGREVAVMIEAEAKR
jgi:hypothetical protein